MSYIQISSDIVIYHHPSLKISQFFKSPVRHLHSNPVFNFNSCAGFHKRIKINKNKKSQNLSKIAAEFNPKKKSVFCQTLQRNI